MTPSAELQIAVDASDLEFNFADDTSGVLAALGLNVFFSGSTARELEISSVLRADPGKFAVSQGGVGTDAANAVELAGFGDRPLLQEIVRPAFALGDA